MKQVSYQTASYIYQILHCAKLIFILFKEEKWGGGGEGVSAEDGRRERKPKYQSHLLLITEKISPSPLSFALFNTDNH